MEVERGMKMSDSTDIVMAEEQLPRAGFNPVGLGETIFNQRYSRTDTETWEAACDRVATHVAQAENGSREKWRGRFYQKLGSGRAKGQLLNCFVVPTDDSREGWGQTVKDMLIISGTGGGVGTNYSPIRPRGTAIKGTGGEATGAVSLMEIINQTGEVIKAGGGRRTALMMCLRYDHADIMEFLNAKLDLKRLNNANVSVLVDDDFFKEVENNGDIVLKFRDRPILDAEGNERVIPANELWNKIIENSYQSAEPYYQPLIATNPCGEIWLEAYGCCCLGAVNLAQHIHDGDMDWEGLAETVTVGVRLLDNVLDVNQYPIKEIEINSQKVRRIGLGIMGLGHALVKMGYKYGSAEALKRGLMRLQLSLLSKEGRLRLTMKTS